MTREQKIMLGGALAAVLAFLIGFGWQYSRAERLEQELNVASKDLAFERLEGKLAAATIEADLGNYEIARQLASDFFTELQADIRRAPEETHQQLNAIAAQRDIIITAASRSDPQTASLIGQLYNTFRIAFGDEPVAAQVPAPAAATTQ